MCFGDAACEIVLRVLDADSKAARDWGDIECAENAIVKEERHRKIFDKTGASARLEDVFLVFNGFPCINVAGLNRAQGINGRQRSMAECAAGPQTGLYYPSERILAKIIQWKEEAARRPTRNAQCGDGKSIGNDDDESLVVSAMPFG